jgi:uncharacterized RDD family membrane protein YckC
VRQSAQENANSLSWKQEVNRRVAEHNGRKGQPASSQDAPTVSQPNGSAAAKAAARVAARYAKAPSYSEMLAEEARAALRTAEAASRAALEAQAAAESVLADLEATLEAASYSAVDPDPEFFTPADPEPARIPAVQATQSTTIAAPPVSSTAQAQSFEIRWDADMPVRESGPAIARASRGNGIVEVSAESLWHAGPNPLDPHGFEVVEAAQPIHANLIEFPRELVATRKVRPRRAEGPYARSLEAEGQLSIFEVEPSAVSTHPEAVTARADVGRATWVGPEWSDIKLDEEPHQEAVRTASAPTRTERARPAPAATLVLQLAPLNQRVLAAIVDFSLITAAFLVAVLVASFNTSAMPSIKVIELGSMVAWALIGALYQAFFFSLSRTTPGMDYAGLGLSTFAGKRPALPQRCVRAGALFLSLLPLGLGVIWAIFDEHNLTWHDRLSGTYLRKG